MTATMPWTRRALLACRLLPRWPVGLFATLLAVNALARPYAGFVHDARLYGFQVLNQAEDGAFADDLFLRFGSQDRFSLFSRVLAPLVRVLGLETSFFLIYFAGNALLILALQRLVLRLVPLGTAAVLGLIYAVAVPLPFGGFDIFQVHEPFLTPRLLANALVLFALERLLSRSFGPALLLLAAAAAFHPLMAFPGLLVWVLVLAWDRVSGRLVACMIAVGCACLGLFPAIPALGTALFGFMDPQWQDIVLQTSSYNFPAQWRAEDWLRVAWGSMIVAGAAWYLAAGRPEAARLLVLLAVVAAAGLAGTMVAAAGGLALLFQGQPYRALWLVQAVVPALTFFLALRLWERGSSTARAAAAVLAFVPWITGGLVLEWCFPLYFFPILVLVFRGLEPTPRRQDWLVRSGVVSLVLGCVAWTVYKCALVFGRRGELRLILDDFEIVRLAVEHLGPMVWVLLGLTLGGLLCTRTRRRWAMACLAVAGAWQLVFFLVPNEESYRQAGTRHQGDLDRLATFLPPRGDPAASPPTLYCSLGRVDFVWLDLRAKSWWDWAQVVGCLFQRGNAVEGQRRALVVRSFELDRYREQGRFVPEVRRRSLTRLFRGEPESARPSVEDFHRLCREPDLDFAILKQEFPEYVSARSGSLFLYDVRRIRARLEAGDAAAGRRVGDRPAAASE